MNGPIAITGATGFVGRRVLALCAEAGLAVRVLARRPAALDASLRSSLEVIEGGILDEDALDRLTAGAVGVIHCAGAIAAAHDDTFAAINVEGTRRLATAARRSGAMRFVQVSSLAAREPCLSPYALSKRLGEREVMDALPGERWAIVRPPVVYGPGDISTLPLIAQLTRRTAWLPGSPRQRFSLLYVDDLARALIHLVQTREPCGAIHDLHDGRPDGYAWADVAAGAAAIQGRPVRVRHVPRLALDPLSRLSLAWMRATGRRLGPRLSPGKVRELYHRDWVSRHNLLDESAAWRPAVPFSDGFVRTVGWYRDNGWLPPDRGVAKRLAGSQGVPV